MCYWKSQYKKYIQNCDKSQETFTLICWFYKCLEFYIGTSLEFHCKPQTKNSKQDKKSFTYVMNEGSTLRIVDIYFNLRLKDIFKKNSISQLFGRSFMFLMIDDNFFLEVMLFI